ncbi:MAG: hypothetical protein TR69_WS6001000708 [candidate division WS6 bacterium OLB20]|uniref:Ig-like domain-containing protein n=1 Tax=candidate division WS6 bacterium OLB20 TaxID=1617426 RepID=A0A136LYK8_9BACT|nr:MAG: hypothetical protein TR69_WS6001000708 [candidate division WS6 bacterium OLB20]
MLKTVAGVVVGCLVLAGSTQVSAQTVTPSSTPTPSPTIALSPAPDVSAPVITITSPVQYSTLSGSVQIQATISDPNLSHYYLSIRNAAGTVVGGRGTITAAGPEIQVNYTFNTASVTDSNYRIVLSAADTRGNTSTRNRWITVINSAGVTDLAPDIAFSMSPAQTLIKGSVTFKATVLDTNLSHYYLVIKNAASEIVGGSGIIYDSIPFVQKDLLVWDSKTVQDGTYTISFAARDIPGNQDDGSRAELTIKVDNQKPLASITNIAPRATVSGVLPVRATINDENLSHYYLAIRDVSGAKIAGPGTVTVSQPVTDTELMSWNTTSVADGTYSIQLSVADLDGDVTLFTRLVNVNNSGPVDDNPPIIFLKQPSAFAAKNVAFTGGVLDTDLTNYTFSITDSTGTVMAGTGTVASTAGFTSREIFTWDSRTAPDGHYTAVLRATDAAGRESVASHTFTVDNTSPVADVYVPSLTIGFINIFGTVDDANISHYYMSIRNSSGQVVGGPGTVQVDTGLLGIQLYTWVYLGLPRGYYTIELHVADKAGNTTSDTLDVYIFGL